MKKIIKNKLVALTIMLFMSHSTLADVGNTSFYLKGIIGANKLNKVREAESLSQKSKVSPLVGVGIGIGYYINDRIRTDLTFDYSLNSFKTTSFFGNSINKVERNIRRTYIHSIMLNGYVDVLNIVNDNFKVFVGGGCGIAQIHEEISLAFTLGGAKQQGLLIKKRVNNFAYSLTTGIDAKITPNINFELAYSWRDFGRTKSKGIKTPLFITNKSYKGHNVSVGIRFAI